MFSRLLTVALLTAGTALAFSTAQAQTSGTSGTGSTGGSTGGSTMTPSTGSGSSGSTMGSGSGSKSMGSSGSSSTQQAQQPMGSGTFNAKNYKTKTECLNAASAQHADRMMCDSLK